MVEVDMEDHMRLVNHSKVNQTLVNGVAVTGAVVLRDMDVLTLADRHIRFQYPDSHVRSSIVTIIVYIIVPYLYVKLTVLL